MWRGNDVSCGKFRGIPAKGSCVTKRILFVEDDRALAEVIGMGLRNAGFDATLCYDGARATEAFHREKPDLVLLDLMLPGKDGISICRSIRESSSVPIVMLTAISDEIRVIEALNAGATDYLVKGMSIEVLIARVRAHLRELATPSSNLTIGDLMIDTLGHTVTRNGEEISLTVIEFKLLTALAKRPWQVFTREMLLQEVWEYRHAADTRLVNVHVQRLRAKIEHDPENPKIVMTVRGVGYKAGT